MGDLKKKIETGDSSTYGYIDIFARPASEPLFRNELLDFWCPIGSFSGHPQKMEVGLCSVKERFDRFDRMERHRYSEEIIIPINGSLFIPVAPPDERPDPEKVRIILVRVGEILNLYPGVWHFACGPLQTVSAGNPLDYFVLLKSGTEILTRVPVGGIS